MKQTVPKPADCFDPRIGLVPVSQAKQRILDSIQTVPDTDKVALVEGLNRVLANSLICHHNVPPHANSAMDGYAIAADSLPVEGTRTFRVAGTAYAGKPFTHPCKPDEVVQVMTGAVMPKNTDTVVIQEDVKVSTGSVTISAGHKINQNVRQAGEDIPAKSVAIETGTRIGPAELGVIASTGSSHVNVYRRPVAAVFSTGDELVNSGQELPPGGIYDSNRFTLTGLLQNTGLQVLDYGIIRDRPDETIASLEMACQNSDVVVTSGGVSTGEADYVIEALQELGEVQLWRIAIRPGRPFAYGKIGNALFFGLPGNPVAVIVTYYALVLPSLRKLMGETNLNPSTSVKAKAITRFRKKPNRAEVYRAILSHDENGFPVVASTGDQGSGLLRSLSEANCFVLLDDDDETAQPGDMVNVQLFNGIF